MAEYYAVERSPEYLAHYGIKGMRWGVQKARERGDSKALARHYRRAQKKLARLNRNADVNAQRAQQVKYAKRSGIGLGVSGLGVGGILASKALSGKYMKNIHAAHDTFYGGMDNRVQRMIQAMNAGDHKTYDAIQRERAEAYKKYVDTTDANFKKIGVSEKAKKVSAVIDLAGLGYGGYAGARSLAAYVRTTPKGHARAVAKRDAWKREMNSAFAGTKYGKKRRRG